MGKKNKHSKKSKYPRPSGNVFSVPAPQSGKTTPKNTGGKGRSEPGKPERQTRLRKWILLASATRQRLSELSKRRGVRLLVIWVLGLFLIAVGYACWHSSRIVKMPDWSKVGPTIQIACDKPCKGAMIYSETDGEGNTTLVFWQKNAAEILPGYLEPGATVEDDSMLLEDDEEEYHLWVYIQAYEDTPIHWNTSNRTGNVENYKITQINSGDYEAYHVEKTGRTSGSDYATVFRISFGGSNFSSANITLSENPDHAVFRANGYFRPRLPWIFPWYGYQSQPYQDMQDDFKSRDANISHSDFLHLSLNGQSMYMPLVEIAASYSSLDLLSQHDLELELVAPESEFSYPLFSWISYDHLFPFVQFYDKRWESSAQKNNLLGGIFIGLGVNVLFTSSNLLAEKRKWWQHV